jgi:hypothetical protein
MPLINKGTYNHLKTHWKPPGCFTVNVTRPVLNPERYQNSQINSTLLERNDTTTDPGSQRQYLSTKLCTLTYSLGAISLW